MRRVLLNIDLGEFAQEPEALYGFAQIANIACGGHAGDDVSMQQALARCRAHGTAAGAHPAYPDREGFGRRALEIDPATLQAAIAQQCARLAAIAANQGVAVEWLKPHGALYHAADRDAALATALIDASVDALGRGVTLIGPPGGVLERSARARGIRFAREGFADRGLRRSGTGRITLIPRTEAGALIDDPEAAAEQARALAAEGGVDTICVHGDTPNAPAIAAAVRAVLDAMKARA